METQVLVVGGGTTGAAIARELSKYKVAVVLAESGSDVATGQTKCNGGIIYSPVGLTWAGSLIIKSIVTSGAKNLLHPESLKEKLALRGYNLFESIARDLDLTSFERCSSLMVATNDDEVRSLNRVEELCREIGCAPTRLDRDAVRAEEPEITLKAIAGLLDRTSEFLVYPWEYCMAMVENARENGVRILTDCEIKKITPLKRGFKAKSERATIHAEFVVNAAGAFADQVAQMVGACDFGLQFMKAQNEILDKRMKALLKNSIHATPKVGGGGRIVPLPSGNLSFGFLDYFPTLDRRDESTSKAWTLQSANRAHELVPAISESDVIKSFTGIRVFNTRDPEDHIIEPARSHPRFINAVIRLPSLAASPAIAEYVVNLLGNQGLALTARPDFNPRRRAIPKPSALPDSRRQALIAKDARFGHVICRCEEVSEGEIVEAIRRGARTLAGVKYRTRAGMGRCQGGFCGSRVAEILARELDIPMTEVTERGGGSRVLVCRTKELLS